MTTQEFIFSTPLSQNVIDNIERINAIDYINPYNHQHKSVLLRTDNDAETHELLAILSKI